MRRPHLPVPTAYGTAKTAGRVARAGAFVGRATRGRGNLLLALLAAIMFAIGWPTITPSNHVPQSLQPAMTVMEVVPILLLRRWPFVAWGVSAGGAVVWWLATGHAAGAVMPWPVVHFLILLLTIVVAAMFARLREVGIVVAVTAALFGLAMPPEMKAWAFGQALFVAFGLLVRWLVISRRQLAKASEETETERARRAVVEERSRIARELHDVVAHHMSMMVVQAQSAPVRLDGMSPEVKDEFASIERSAREALNEVRGVLGVLREERGPQFGGGQLAPQPDASDLAGLLEGARAAGVHITWQLDLDEEDVSAGVGLVLHRIMQESLANASRHAPGAPVEVTLARHGHTAQLLVRNGPPARRPVAAWPDEAGGNGIPGMRTRAEALGGDLHAGPTEDGGFVVQAMIPLSVQEEPRVADDARDEL